jgi:aerobic carbon-monoxide dehydrogenase large subunit
MSTRAGAPPAPGLIGAAVTRVEDARYTTGTGRYLDDLVEPNMVHARFVRSQQPHGKLASVEVSEEDPLPQGATLITGRDCGDLAVAAEVERVDSVLELQHAAQPPLAIDRVRYVGEPVAAVLHPDPYVAEDAAERVRVEVEPLPVVCDLEAALASDAATLHDGWEGNLFVRRRRAFGDLAGARSAGGRVVRRAFRMHRQAGVPLENRGCLAVPDASRLGVTLWSSTQIPHLVRTVVAERLGLQEAAVRVIAPDVGGGFGVKGHVFPDEVLVAWLALHTRRPVKWVEDRGEHLVSSIHARDHLHLVEASVDDSGRLLGVRLQVVVDVGAYSVYPWTAGSDGGMVAKVFPGPYDIRNYEVEDLAVATNKCPLGTYRGVGRPAAVFTMERLMDEIGRELGIDPVEVRRRNLIEEFPYETVTGLAYDPGSYRESLDLVAGELEGPVEAEPAEGADVAVGYGLALYNEQTAHGALDFEVRGGPIESGYQSTTMRVEPDGSVAVFTGLQSHGQGMETTLAQVAATELGVTLEAVRVVHGDTARSPYAMGTWGSRGAALGGGSVARTARIVRTKVLDIAAHLLEADPADLDLVDGRITVRGSPSAELSLAQVARVATRSISRLPREFEPGLESTVHYDGPPRGTFSNACHGAVVWVDRATGKVVVKRYVVVEDCGTMINPTVVDGQVHGGVAQGLGSALLEEFTYGADGQPLTTTFADYRLPTSADIPDIEVRHLSTPSPWTEHGIKGMGEAGAIGPMAAVANAVSDALGAGAWETPLTMSRVWRLRKLGAPTEPWARFAGIEALAGFWARGLGDR